MPLLQSFCAWLENTPLGMFISGSTWAFPTVESIHVFFLVIVVGSIAIVDLRLVGVASRNRSVSQLSKQPADPAAAERGQALFKDKGNCFDCHAPDGSGNPDYGSTDFTAGVWTYGGDRVTLFKSVRDGRHGLMQAYIGKLTPVQIRALAVDIYERSRAPTQVASN